MPTASPCPGLSSAREAGTQGTQLVGDGQISVVESKENHMEPRAPTQPMFPHTMHGESTES